MTANDKTFGASLGEVFASGVRGYTRNVIPLTVSGAATLGVYAIFRIPAQQAFESGDVVRSLAIDLVGLLLASIVALPWYAAALAAVDGKSFTLATIFESVTGLYAQAVASFWFWAAILLGLRYLLAIPAMLAVVFYAFYGFAVADGAATGGLKALGYSARLGEGRRVGIAAVAIVLLLFTLLGAFPVGFGVSTLTVVLAVCGLVVTCSITLVAGAAIYRLLQEQTTSKTRTKEN